MILRRELSRQVRRLVSQDKSESHRLQPAERRRLRRVVGDAYGAVVAPAAALAERRRRQRISTQPVTGRASAAAAGPARVEPAAAAGPVDRRRRLRTGADGTARYNGAGGGGARTRVAAGLHAARPGQLADPRHSPVSTRAHSHWLGTRREWSEGRWTSRAGPG